MKDFSEESLEEYYFGLQEDEYDTYSPTEVLSPIEQDILKVLTTYLTITKYLLHKPAGRKKELKKNIKKIQKIKEALLRRDGTIKKYLDEEGQYYDLL